jgi:prolyl oligopeptidase
MRPRSLVFSRHLLFLFFCRVSMLGCLMPSLPLDAAEKTAALTYPEARRSDVAETLHGVTVPDPYRWLEELDSPETTAWVKAQQALTENVLSQLPQRERLKKRLTEAWDYDKHGLPRRIAGKLFYSRKTGLQNQGVHYWREDRPDAPEIVLLDANALSEDGTVAVAGTSVSDDGRFFAYALAASGSDWNTWHVLDVQTGKKLPDELRWTKFSGASWSPDHKGFYYSRYAAPVPGQELKDTNLDQKLYYHRLGDPQEQDQLIYERPDHPKWGFGAGITDDQRFLVIHVWEGAGSKNALFYRDLKAGAESPVIELFAAFDARYDLVGNDDDVWYVLTDKDAPRSRLVAVNLKQPQPQHWKTILAESAAPLQSVSDLSGRFIASYMIDAHDEVRVFDRTGKRLGQVDAPALSSVGGFGGRQEDTETFYAVSSYTSPGAIFRYDVKQDQSTLFWQPDFPIPLDPYITEQHFFTSKDGTRVPLFLTRRKDAPRDGSVPTILYGYGGFNISLTPGFAPSIAVWLEQGGAYAVVNLRGGGEYGETWHEAGQKQRKQNVFDDFIAAAEFLIAEKHTSKAKLVIKGGSNGGLLVAAVTNQRPDLFAAAAPSVGVMDMLRFHKFTIGWAWQDEYGSPDNPDDFKNLLRYSPCHNLRTDQPYPPMLIETADHDDRVFPAHSFKFGAALQHTQTGTAPILMRIESKAGHGAGKPTSKVIDAQADEYAFFLHHTRG